MLKSVLKTKNRRYAQRKRRVRANISGCESRPRVTVFRSNKHFYAQAIDDTKGHTLAYSDGIKLGVKPNKEGAAAVAKDLGDKLKAAGVEGIVFDRNGYLYHGVVAAFAEALRESGIKF
jgi:large subunit ribosomal protein L18